MRRLRGQYEALQGQFDRGNLKDHALRPERRVGTDHAQGSKPLSQFGVVTRVTLRLLPGPDTVNVLASRITRSSSLALKIG